MIAFDSTWTGADDRGTCTVRLGGITVSVTSELEEVAADFAELYHGSPAGEPADARAIRMEVRRVRGAFPLGERYQIFGDGEEMGKPLRRNEVLPFLEWGINWRVIATRRDFLQLHAAGMVRDGVGVVLTGGSGSGKSTLAAALLARGWQYYSDELILIDPATGFMHPYPKAICVKSGAFDVMRQLSLPFSGGRHYVKGLKGRVGYINPHGMGPNRIAAPGPARYIVFPKYTRGIASKFFPMSRARSVYALVAGTLNRTVFADQGVSVLTKLAAGAECIGLDAGPIEQSCDMLDSLVDAGRERVAG